MRNFKMIKKLLVILGSGLLINQAFAGTAPVVAGTDYTVLTSPVHKAKEPNGKVNVKLFFSFTCIHCKDVEPMVEKMLVPNKKIDVERIHVAWDPTTSDFAKLNATYQIMNLNKLNVPTFTAVFARQNLNESGVLKAFLTKNGLSSAQIGKFMDNYSSFTVSSTVSEYKSLMTTYSIEGTPTFIVADTYVVKPAQPPRLIEVVTNLVNKELAATK